MGAALGIPEWLAATLFVGSGLCVVMAYSYWKHGRQMRRLVTKRPNPSREEFLSLMSGAVDEDVAVWMWETLLPYYQPHTPHPDDDLIRDAWIDDDDIAMDWLPRFAGDRGLRWQDWPEWPKDWTLTAINFARYLQSGVTVYPR